MTTEERIAHLEHRLEKLHDAQVQVDRQLAQAYLDQWQGRIDDLRLQAHLGAAEASDRLEALTAELEKKWTGVRQQVAAVGATTADVAEIVRSGVESAYQDLRDALIESRKQLTP